MTPTHQELTKQVLTRAGNRCEYCQMHQSLQGATFHLEHVIPKSDGGSTTMENLAFACPSCNLHKSDRTEVEIRGSDESVQLYNPRLHSWTDHFQFDEYHVIGKTNIGKVTADVLNFNLERRIKIRQAEQMFGLFPPT